MTKLSFAVPDARCVSCGKLGPCTVRHVVDDNGKGMVAALALPDGWARLSTDAYSVREFDAIPKTFGMCKTCYQALPNVESVVVTVTVVRLQPMED